MLRKCALGLLSIQRSAAFITIRSTASFRMSTQTHWVTTAIRIKDPSKSLPYYETMYGMTLVDEVRSNTDSRYFLARLKEGQQKPEGRENLFNTPINYVELMHHHGVENDPSVVYDSGNNEPKRGFGHLAFNTADVYASSEKLEKAGVSFKKKPDEGRMKGLAFAYDPDGYWIEIVSRSEEAGFKEEFNLSQTMLRVKDPEKSLAFYRDVLGMKLLNSRHFSDFSLYFLMSITPDMPPPPATDEEGRDYIKKAWAPVLELTHNHGTENDPNFKHHTGNTDPLGFSSIGFMVEDLQAIKTSVEGAGFAFAQGEQAAALGGADEKVLVAYDPDGYAVRMIQKGAVL